MPTTLNTTTVNPQTLPIARLSVFALVMINIIAVASLRTLPFSAKFGLPLITYYLLAAIVFFIPVALITAELATTWPENGGIYVWIRAAFGARIGLLVVWLQWVYNVVWYPTILSLIAGVSAYLFDPGLVDHRLYMTCMVVGTFWLATLLNWFGMNLSSLVSTIGSMLGTVLPMLAIMGIGIYWYTKGQVLQINFEFAALVPHFNKVEDLVLINAILFGLIGLEMSAVHAAEVKNPARDYPKALAISGVAIILLLIFGSLVVAMIIPANALNLVVAPMQAFQIFLQSINMLWLLPVVAILIIIGAVSCVATWIIGPTKGLLIAAQDGNLPPWFAHTNKYGVPSNILICQGVIVTLLALAYLLMPTAEAAYMILTELTAILALLMYAMMFIAAIVLRYKFPNIVRPYKIPGGKFGIWLVAIPGLLTSGIAILLGFIPPSQINIGTPLAYQAIMIVGTLTFCLPALLLRSK